MTLSIIIINYKTPQLTCRCIESVLQSSFNDMEILVVDNASNDGSKEIITTAYPMVKWIQNNYNEGFGRANNAGIDASKGKFILFLNSDMYLNKNTIKECYEHIACNQGIGVLSCRILNEDGSIQRYESTIASYRKYIDYNLVVNYLFPARKFKQEAVMGSFMLIPRRVLDECGWFDPDFFFYSEEIELCNRIRKKKYEIKVLEHVFAHHKGGGSIPDRIWANRQAYLSLSLLFLKIKSFSGFYLFHLIFLFNFAVNFIAMWFLDSDYRTGYIKDLRNYLSVFGRMMLIPFLFSKNFGTGKRLLKY